MQLLSCIKEFLHTSKFSVIAMRTPGEGQFVINTRGLYGVTKRHSQTRDRIQAQLASYLCPVPPSPPPHASGLVLTVAHTP